MASTSAANGLASPSTSSRQGPTRAMSAASLASAAARCRSAAWRSKGWVTETDRVGFEPTKRLPVYTLSRRVPSATRPPIHAARRAGPQGPGRAGRPRKTRGNISAGRPPKRYVCRHERSGCVAESVAGRVDGRGARCAGRRPDERAGAAGLVRFRRAPRVHVDDQPEGGGQGSGNRPPLPSGGPVLLGPRPRAGHAEHSRDHPRHLPPQADDLLVPSAAARSPEEGGRGHRVRAPEQTEARDLLPE